MWFGIHSAVDRLVAFHLLSRLEELTDPLRFRVHARIVSFGWGPGSPCIIPGHELTLLAAAAALPAGHAPRPLIPPASDVTQQPIASRD